MYIGSNNKFPEDNELSENHFKLSLIDGIVHIEDNNSKYGTWYRMP